MSNQVICRECGHENLDGDQFCGSCGSFLEWTGAAVADAPLAAQEPEPARGESAFVSQLKRVIEVDVESVARHDATEDRLAAADASLAATRDRQRLAAEAEARQAQHLATAAEEAAATARRRVEDDQLQRDEEAAAEAAALEAESAAASARAEAAAAKVRAESEHARQQAEAAEAQRQREAALRRAELLIAPAHNVVADVGASRPGAPQAAKPDRSDKPRSLKGAAQQPTTDQQPTTGTGTADAPLARTPGRERIRGGPKRGPAAELNPGDLVCGQCGTGNPPARKFCRKCGTALADSTVAKLGLWARITRRFRRAPKQFKAGERHRRRSGRSGGGDGAGYAARRAFFKLNSTLLRLGAALGMLALLGFGVEPIRAKLQLPNFRQQGIDKVRAILTPVYDQVRPSAADGAGATDHGADQLIDNGNNTWWSSPAGSGAGRGSKVTVSFAKPVDLARMIVTAGVPGTQDEGTFVSQPRPAEMRVVLNGDTVGARTIGLKDRDTPQTLTLSGKKVQTVDIEILEVYPASPASTAGVAITELEFFSKRKYGDNYETIAIPQVSASSSTDQLKFLVDGDTDTAWTSAPPGDGVGESVTVRFAEPVDLDRVRITTGYGTDTTRVSPRPSDVQLVFTCRRGCQPTVQMTLPDKRGFRTAKLDAKGVTEVQLQIRAVHGTGGGAAISELQFQRKRPKGN